MASPSDIAVRVTNLSKKFRVGEVVRPRSMGDMLARMSPFAKTPVPSQGATRGEFLALNDVSFELPRGEVLGIVGRNGAGKSTLLKTLARITAPTSGRIEYAGRVGALLEVGTGFHPELTGRENMFLNGAILGMSGAEVRRSFDAIVDFSGVEKFIDTPVKHYSSGMYMRLAFAVAAHLRSDILIVDEVLAVGDAAFQEKCLGKMGELAGGGRTVLFVSHNMGAVAALCTRVLALRNGGVAEYSTDVHGAISRYIFGEAGTSPQWIGRHADPVFTATRLAITDAAGSPVAHALGRGEDAWVVVEGELSREVEGFKLGYTLFADTGEKVYETLHTDMGPDAPPLSAGPVRLRCAIPTGWLNPNRYVVEMNVSLHNDRWILRPGFDAPTASFEVAGKMSPSPFWTVSRKTQVAPLLPWLAQGPPRLVSHNPYPVEPKIS